MPDDERTSWGVFTEGDLEVLKNLKSILDEKRRQKEAHIAFLRSVWDDALDATGNPWFRDRSKEKDEGHGKK